MLICLICLGWIFIAIQISLHRVVSVAPLKGATELGQGAQEMDTRCANSIGWEQQSNEVLYISLET